MLSNSFRNAIALLFHHPVLWMSGIYTGCCSALLIWLELNDDQFLAGKLLFITLVLFPFFVAGVLTCLKEGDFSVKRFISGGREFFFPVILPGIVLGGMIILMIFLLAIPLSIAGMGSDPAMMGGLFVGVTIPAILFAMYYDIIAVSEGTGVFLSLKRSMELFGKGVFLSVGYLIISALTGTVLAIGGSMIWGIILAEKFTPYLNLTMIEQQEVFSGFTPADWQQILGPDGMMITIIAIAIYAALMVPFLTVFRFTCYQALEKVKPEPYGEYDEKGRWYRY